MGGQVVIETRKLTKVYRDFWGRQKKVALNALNLEIYQGEVFGLLGPNGSGKTTTIKLLLGLLFPTDGDAFVFSKPAADVKKNERIGYLPEESYLYRFLNATSAPSNSSTWSASSATASASSRSIPRACASASAWPRR